MPTPHAFICDALRTPFGRYGGMLSPVRADGLAALPISVPGGSVNRLCGSGPDALGSAVRAIRCGETRLMIAGGVQSMSRAPFVMPKAEGAFSRHSAVYDTTIGWRFINRLMKKQYGVDSMPETAKNTAENVATEFRIERAAQDRMRCARSSTRWYLSACGHVAAPSSRRDHCTRNACARIAGRLRLVVIRLGMHDQAAADDVGRSAADAQTADAKRGFGSAAGIGFQ
jgi:acetyl-CoA acyltransferase